MGYDEIDDVDECFYTASDFLDLTSVIIQLPAASPATVPVQHARWRLFEGAPEASWMFVGISSEASRGPVGGSFEYP